MRVIKFYREEEQYGCFSNFSSHPIQIKGEVWATVEHYFQAQKFYDTPHEEEIRNASSPMKAKILGNDKNKPLRPDWESVKNDIMREALFAKFSQHPELKKALIETGDAYLVEHTKNDSYWGDGGDGRGRNMLGSLLMEIRKRLPGIQ